MSRTGWSCPELSLVGEDERLWTFDEAVRYVGPPQLSTAQVRQLVSIMIALQRLEPVGVRRPDRTDRRGRSARVYRAIDVIRLFDDLTQAA